MEKNAFRKVRVKEYLIIISSMGLETEIDPITSCHYLVKVLITVCHVDPLCIVAELVARIKKSSFS